MTGERGQASVELALVLPLVAILLLGVVQVAVVAARQVAVTDAARDAARAAASGADDSSTAGTARAATGLDPDRLSVEVARVDGAARVTVRYHDPTDVPLVGLVMPPFEEAATVRFPLEGGGDPVRPAG